MTTTDPLTGQQVEVISKSVVRYPRPETAEQRTAREKKGEPQRTVSFTVTQIAKPK